MMGMDAGAGPVSGLELVLLKSLGKMAARDENHPEIRDAHPVSGTSPLKIVEKQPFKASHYADCSTQLSHNRVRDAALSYSNDDVIVDPQCSTRVSHRRPIGLWRRGAVYQYRVRVPHDLVPLIGKTHFSRSLKTAARNEALRALRKVAFEIELEFDGIRVGAGHNQTVTATKTMQRGPVEQTMVPKVTGPTLKQTIDGYMSDPTRSQSPKSQAVYRSTYATIASILGEDTPVRDIGRDTCRDLLSIVQNLPSNARKRFPSLSPSEAAEHAKTNDIAPMSVANINEYMNKLSNLLNWACKEQWVSRNVATGLRLAVSAKNSDRRRPFSEAQLKKIFNAPLYRGCRDDGNGYATPGQNRPRRGRFWIPLIGLYSGARLNEICQLHTADLRLIDGIWCFDFSADESGNKRFKTAASQRLVPIHPTLIKLGILVYLRDRKEARDQRMSPEIAIDAFGMHSGRVSRWFARYLNSCGAAGEGVCFHSFRHSFRDALREAGIEREMALRLGGWSESGGASNAVGDSYGSGFSPSRLHAAISGINYAGLKLDHLVLDQP